MYNLLESLLPALTRSDILWSAIASTIGFVAFLAIWVWQYKSEGLLINPKKDPRSLLAWFVAIVSVGITAWLSIHFWLML